MCDECTSRALDLLRAKEKDGARELEKTFKVIVSTGTKKRPNAFITDRAKEVLDVCG